MYARIHRLSLDPAKSRAIMRFTENEVIPKLRQSLGFRRYTVLGDLTAGRAVTITEWNTLEQAQKQLTALDVAQETAELGIDKYTIEVLEVVAQA